MAEAASYWEGRRNVLYYQVVRVLTEGLGKKAKSIIDVGSGGCPYLDWFPKIAHRTSLDIAVPHVAEGVTSVKADFLAWTPDRRYDIVLCLQVLEHIPDAGAFARKLLDIGAVVVASVPYKWPHGKTASHVHDPVDEEKMLAWFGRAPNFSYVCREVVAPVERLICVYDRIPDAWTALNRRDMALAAQAAPAPPA